MEPGVARIRRSVCTARIGNRPGSASFRPVPARFDSPPHPLRIHSRASDGARSRASVKRARGRGWRRATTAPEAMTHEGDGGGTRRRRLGDAPAATFSSAAFSPVSCLLSPLSSSTFLGVELRRPDTVAAVVAGRAWGCNRRQRKHSDVGGESTQMDVLGFVDPVAESNKIESSMCHNR